VTRGGERGKKKELKEVKRNGHHGETLLREAQVMGQSWCEQGILAAQEGVESKEVEYWIRNGRKGGCEARWGHEAFV